MAETVYLNDGSMEVVLDEREKGTFLENLIRDKLGDDAARCFREYINDLQEEAEYTEQALKEAEKVADGYLEMLREACKDITCISDELSAPRLNRATLSKLAARAWGKINNNL